MSMQEELKPLEPKLKEILYKFMEDVRSTKAALYLLDENESYELVTNYGFRSAESRYDVSSVIVDRLVTKRAPFSVNGLTADPRFSELLYKSDTTRLLIAPIYARGKLVGFIDQRDKARQANYDQADLDNSQKIVDEFVEVFTENKLFGLGGANAPKQTVAPVIETAADPTLQHPAFRLAEDAKAMLARGVMRGPANGDVVSERQLTAASLALPAIIGLPGVLVASVMPISRLGGTQIVTARTEVSAGAMEHFEGKIRGWLKKRGESGPVAARTTMIFPYGTGGVPIEASRIQSVLSAPVRVGAQDGMVLSVGFEMQPDASTRGNLEKFLVTVQQLVALASSAEAVTKMKERIALRLLEPEFQSYPALVTHSKRVADLAERLAAHVGLSEEEVENIRIAALVHDVGMRFLEYKNIYRKSTLSNDDLRLIRSHPTVGAAVIADVLGSDIAQIVLSHHERPDGTGYPDALPADRIPLGSKIIHICEAFDAMTSTDSYQPPVTPQSAAGKIKRAGGSQFDAELSVKFVEMLGLG